MQHDRQLLHRDLDRALSGRDGIAQRKGLRRRIVKCPQAGIFDQRALLRCQPAAQYHAARTNKRQQCREPDRAAAERRMQKAAVLCNRHRQDQRIQIPRQSGDMFAGRYALRQRTEAVKADDGHIAVLCEPRRRRDLPQIAAGDQQALTGC